MVKRFLCLLSNCTIGYSIPTLIGLDITPFEMVCLICYHGYLPNTKPLFYYLIDISYTMVFSLLSPMWIFPSQKPSFGPYPKPIDRSKTNLLIIHLYTNRILLSNSIYTKRHTLSVNCYDLVLKIYSYSVNV